MQYAQATTNQIFAQYVEDFMTCWINDILGYASDEGTLLAHLDKVLVRCSEFGLKLNPSKCDVFLQLVWPLRIPG